MRNAADIAEELCSDFRIADASVGIQVGEFRMQIRSNSSEVLDHLRNYYSFVASEQAEGTEILAIDRPVVDLDVPFRKWRRPPGKTRRKDGYCDLPGGRLIRKVRTGMLFLQSHLRVACGPCMENNNQVINFVNSQFMNWLQQNGATICHAAAVTQSNKCFGIAGFSGAGKSSLTLRLLELPGMSFATNDRLFLQRNQDRNVEAIGIPKMPRVNPGTLV